MFAEKDSSGTGFNKFATLSKLKLHYWSLI